MHSVSKWVYRKAKVNQLVFNTFPLSNKENLIAKYRQSLACPDHDGKGFHFGSNSRYGNKTEL